MLTLTSDLIYRSGPERTHRHSWVSVRSAFRRYCRLLTYARSDSPPSRPEDAARRKAERPLPQLMCNIRRLAGPEKQFCVRAPQLTLPPYAHDSSRPDRKEEWSCECAPQGSSAAPRWRGPDRSQRSANAVPCRPACGGRLAVDRAAATDTRAIQGSRSGGDV